MDIDEKSISWCSGCTRLEMAPPFRTSLADCRCTLRKAMKIVPVTCIMSVRTLAPRLSSFVLEIRESKSKGDDVIESTRSNMTRKANFQGRLILILALITACMTIVQSTKTKEEKIDIDNDSREKRHVGITEVPSTDRGERSTNIPNIRVFNKSSSSSKSNEISSETGRKVSHRLIGGHLRDDRVKKLCDVKDEDMLASSVGNGKETKSSLRSDDDDERKTLSQQVKEGKYGLIQNEIYENEDKPRRPGIISYLDNPEVPRDTIENLGGLDEDEIWLAENHLLVLKGGNFPGLGPTNRPSFYPSNKNKEKWPPIDNYQAPKRQVKIPSKPKVPPPFPVQLKDGGPIQIIGINGSTEIENVTLDRTMDPFYGKGGILPGDGPFFTITSNGTIVVPDFDYPFNSTTDDVKGSTVTNDDGKNIKSEEPPIFYHAIPPGAVFVPPPSNRSDYDDEDQSIYYPPPYSFYYPQDNTTSVPPGPLVPGIILPPPPDFFSSLEEKKTTTKKYTKRPGTSMLPKSRPTYLPPRKLTTRKQWESTTVVPRISTTQLPRTRIYNSSMLKNLTGTPVTRIRPSTVPYEEVTTVIPEIRSTLRNNNKYYGVSSLIGNRVIETSTEDKVQTWPRSTNSKSLPVLTYYASTTPSSIDESVEVTPASIKNVITTEQPVQLPNRASYYFYEESNDGNVASTVESAPVYYQTTTESPYYKLETLSQQSRDEKPYYRIETNSPKDISSSRDYNVKLIDALVDNPQIFQYRGSEDSSTKYDSTLDRDQGERLLADQAPIYYQTITPRPSLSLQRSYYTTPKSSSRYYQESKERVDNRQDTISKPIYQYSFEVTDYSRRDQDQRPYYRQQNERVTYDYQTVKSNNNQRYNYENDQPDKVPYKIQSHIYPSTTGRSTLNVTPNPQHAYFTRQEERLLDDVTKEYFTIFGKKINGKETQSTTPIYNKANHVTEKPNYNVNRYVSNDYNVPPEITYRDQLYYDNDAPPPPPPPNLESDTRVNYRRPLPPINPDSEFIEVFDPKQRGQPYVQQEPTISLKDDILVNYRNPRPSINPDAEFIHPISIPNQGSVNTEKNSAYFAYRLPGDGGHFYFLTPQAIRQEQNGGDSGSNDNDDDGDGGGGGDGGGSDGYYYPKPKGPKLLRRRRNLYNV
ncbi:uncharacterized protein LOC124428769 isoform X2 [Vespa crabro]|uniref:uncharacterized protein LOC124428769 isoform X2 n=1 Tax=Vespa crabro TaxID=7445 RepID=UPI001F00F1BF|nr:uncharacterized protein LOC124428769 isoform X2 [Vespa crabro]